MKQLHFFFLIVCAAAFSSCHKHVQTTAHTNGKVLPGVWELRFGWGGMTPYNLDDYRPGNGSLWKFTETEFTRVYRDSVYASGTYTVAPRAGTDLNTGRKVGQFVFNGQPSLSFELKDDTLRFYHGLIAADGTIEMYVKIADNH